jgi:hypothetical protein
MDLYLGLNHTDFMEILLKKNVGNKVFFLFFIELYSTLLFHYAGRETALCVQTPSVLSTTSRYSTQAGEFCWL